MVSLEYIIENKITSLLECFVGKQTDSDQLVYECLIGDCKRIYQDKSNAIRHIRVNHQDEYHNIRKNKAAIDNNDGVFAAKIELRVSVDVEQIWDACVDLITVNALPFNFVEYAAFKKLLAPYKLALANRGVNLEINRHNIKERIHARATETRDKIREEVKNKPLCLMIDIGSRYNRSVFGVNVSFFANDKMNIRNIGMHVLRVNHTADNLVEIIKTNLSTFGISLVQIISVTSDNGANMLRTVVLMDEELNKEQDEENNGTGSNADVSENEDEEMDLQIFDEGYYVDLLTNVRAGFQSSLYVHIIHGVSCAAHCLHLIVIGAFAVCLQAMATLESCRNLAKKLRTSKYRNLLVEAGLNQTRLDQDTRWNSKYDMMKRLLSLRHFCENSSQLLNDKTAAALLLDDTQWTAVEHLISVLEPFHKYTVMLPSERCTLSDFFGFWGMLKMKTLKHCTTVALAKELMNEMKKRESVLLDNPVMQACIYMDPRYQRTLTDDQKLVAICFLKNLYMKLQSIKNDVSTSPAVQLDETQGSCSSSDEFEVFINSMQNESHNVSPQATDESVQISRIDDILNILWGAREDTKIKVLDYWQKKKLSDPELYELANVVYSIPPTQATVERCFSALAIVLTQRRTRMLDNILENILIVRLNPEIRIEGSPLTKP